MLTRRGVQRFRFFDIAGFHRVGKGFGAANQLRGFRRHIGFIGGDRVAEAQHRIRFRRVFGGGAGDDQFAFRVGEQATGHVIFARLQVRGELLSKARRDVFALFHHHHPFQNLPLQRFLAVVLNNKLGFTRVNGHLHRLALLVVDGRVSLISSQRPVRQPARQWYYSAAAGQTAPAPGSDKADRQPLR